MKIVIDTNVLVSGIFFGGKPGKLLQMVAGRELEADRLRGFTSLALTIYFGMRR